MSSAMEWRIMAESIKMPQLGESVAEGTIGNWLKRPGDRVERDEPLVEVMTDKVNADIPSSAAGILERILAPEGTVVAVNQEIAIIGDGSNVVGLDEELGAEAGAATPSALDSPAAQEPVDVAGAAGGTPSAAESTAGLLDTATHEGPRFYTPVVM